MYDPMAPRSRMLLPAIPSGFLSTPSRGDAVTSGYESQASSRRGLAPRRLVHPTGAQRDVGDFGDSFGQPVDNRPAPTLT